VDYDVWVDETGADWSYQNLKPFGEQIHRDFNIHVRSQEFWTRLDYLFRDAAQGMGYQLYDATLAKKNCLWSGYCDGINHCKYDARQGSFFAYLPIAEERGVEMISDATVERIVFEKRGAQARVVGVEYVQDGVQQRLDAPSVIVSCGDYGNPPLLYRSGYGPRELTDGDPVVENRNVGRNTDNRPQFQGPVGIFDEPVSEGDYRHASAHYIYHDLDPKRHYDRLEIMIRPNQLPPPDRVAMDSAAPEFGHAHKQYMRDAGNSTTRTRARKEIISHSSSSIHLTRPRSVRGWINEWGEQFYQAHDPSILKALEQGREVVYELLKKMGAREILGMDQPIRVGHLSTFVGSCIVGVDPKNSVVNPYFESHDIEGLFICDGSVVPRAASQGYAGTVATVALFAASRIVGRHFTRG
jgi:choline dehydrogenase-like flavoprotein